MLISHASDGKIIQKEVDEDSVGFLMSNKKGGFFSLGVARNFSRYNGSFFAIPNSSGFDMYKVIESINLIDTNVKELRNNFFNVERYSQSGDDEKKIKERFYMNHSNTILYEAENFDGVAQLLLDCRHIYDLHDEGRIYRMTAENGKIIIEYTKYKDRFLNEINYRIYLVVSGVDDYRKTDQWLETDYVFDHKRDTLPLKSYVFEALRFRVKGKAKVVLTYSDSKKDALELSRNACQNYDYLKKSMKNYITKVTFSEIKCKTEPKFAYMCAKNSMDYLLNTINDKEGIYAGLPWFHQFWTRDEAISLGALIEEENFQEVKIILWRQLDFMLPDGRISNRYPMSALASADGVGWCFKRVFDFLKTLEKKKCFYDYITKDDVMFLKKKLRFSIKNLLINHTSDGLSINDNLETWMDTFYKDDTRSGFRIEIQALRLSMYRLMRYLCLITDNKAKYHRYDKLERATRAKVKEVFWHTPVLNDGLEDPTIRPNIFLTYYLYPQLLKKEEWVTCFDHALKALWLEWGGLATIDKSHSYFFNEYSGENNKSYHRGDSWFFVNNIAAIVMYNLDSNHYAKYIDGIFDASSEDLLFKCIIGHGSELSSAKEQRAQGSPVQAWSAATFIELMHKLHR